MTWIMNLFLKSWSRDQTVSKNKKKKKKIQNMIVKGIELKTDVKSGNAAATADRQIVLAARADAE